MIFGPQNYSMHFTHASALMVRKFWSAFYPLMVHMFAGPHFTHALGWHGENQKPHTPPNPLQYLKNM